MFHRWHLTAGEKGIILLPREFGLVPTDANRDCVHMLQRDTAVLDVDDTDARVVTLHSVCHGVSRWDNEWYYMTRFFVDRGEQLDNITEEM